MWEQEDERRGEHLASEQEWHRFGMRRDGAGKAPMSVGGGCAGELLLGAGEPEDLESRQKWWSSAALCGCLPLSFPPQEGCLIAVREQVPSWGSGALDFFSASCSHPSWPCSLPLPPLVLFPQLWCCGMGRLF